MENQVNIETQNTQPVGQNPVVQPTVIDKPKTNITALIIVPIVCSLVFGFGGYYLGMRTSTTQPYINQNQPVPTNSPETTLIQPSSTPIVTSSPSISLKKYTSKFEKLSFQYPSDWKLSSTQPQSNFPEGDALGIQDPNGKAKVSWISAIDGLGGSCDPNIPFNQVEGEMGAPCPLYEVVDKQKLPNVDLYYVAYFVTRDGVKYEPTFALQAPDGLLTTKRAMAYLLFFGKNNGKVLAGLSGTGLTTGTKAEVQNFFTTPEAIQAKNILLSVTY